MKKTKEFIKIWNKKNGYTNEITSEGNMRYVSPNVVTWNEYNAPVIHLKEIVLIYNSINNYI